MSAGSILVPLDGSPQSEAVLPLATAIAKAQAQALTLVSVVEPGLQPVASPHRAGLRLGA